VKNAEVAEQLGEIADLLDVLGERFKPEAYRRAARSIESLAEPVEAVAARGGLREIPGVGEAIDEKVREYLRTGTIPYLEKLRKDVPAGLRELMRVPGVGPKTARRFWTDFGVEGPTELAEALRAGKFAGAKGFGERKIAQLTAALASATAPGAGVRVPIERAYPVASALLQALQSVSATQQVAVAGSFRRGRESVGDLDILVTSSEPEAVFDAFSRLPDVKEVRLRGPTKETVVTREGLQVDLRVVEPEAFGAALQYFTGSKDHNVRLRSLARDRGLKINEYGVFRGDERVGGRTEEEVYGLLELPWIPPELREDRGEIALAQKRRLPSLVEKHDLVGELHVHLPAPAGPRELERLVDEARRRRWEYVGVVTQGIDEAGKRWAIPEATREAVARMSTTTTRILSLDEVLASPEGPAPDGPPVDGRLIGVLDAGRARDLSRETPVVGIVHLAAHGSAELDRAVALARALGTGVEVGPGDRADSNVARAAKEAGAKLLLPTGLAGGDAEVIAEVALGFARRAGAERSDVRNAGPFAPVSAKPRKSRR
jgi:DNA polymerase (family 10)